MSTPKHPKANLYRQQGLYAGVKTFAELEQRIAALADEQSRGDAFEVFAEAYLATQPTQSAREVWPDKAIEPSLRERLCLYVRDVGADGVMQTNTGEYHGYQVKFRSNRTPLAWEETSTFFGVTDRCNQRFLFTNSDDISAVSEQRKDFYSIRGNDLDKLEQSDFEAIQTWISGAELIRERKTPKQHQQEALAALMPAIEKRERVTAVMACGSGKTLVALWTTERIGSSKVLVLVPSLALLRQTLHEWLRETSWQRVAFLCVCSDPTVSSDLDALQVQPSELDFPVSTESAAVRKFLGAPFDGVKLIFSTYQSAKKVAEGMKPGESFDIGIFDEAHKTAGREGRNFAFALEDENLSIRKRLFLTATPRHYNIAKRDKQGDSTLVYSMDESKTYGRVEYKLPFSEAIERDIICDYRVLITEVTSDQVTDELLRRGIVLVDGEEIKARQVANQIALAEAVKKHQVQKIFTFHGKIESARSFTLPGPEGVKTQLPDFQAFHVNGGMSTALRERYMNAFRIGDRCVMSNARCLTEGVDVPAVDMVAFLSARRSMVDIVQATGRAIRHSGNKTTGYVLVPLYRDASRGETVEQAKKRGGFDEIWEVLQSLKEHDDVLADTISKMREERGRTGGFDDSRFREKVEVLGSSISLDDLRNAITVACVDALGVSWDERYGELIAYKERFGTCDMPARWPENRKLAKWVVEQRRNRKRGRLTREQIQSLDKLEFVWQPKSRDWRTIYLRLVEYNKIRGNCNVPQKWSKDRKLATWVRTQRQDKADGKMPDERIRLLDGLGFEWNLAKPVWEHRFQQLVEYRNKHDHCDVPARWRENHQLASFVIRQRQDRKAGKLSEDQIRRLDEIGFVWKMQEKISEAQWMRRYVQLRAFKEKHGNCIVPKHNESLANWVTQQRKRRKKGLLSERKLKLLDELGFVWDAGAQRSVSWEEMFAALLDYKSRFDDCKVPPRWKPVPKLGEWVMDQRQAQRKGRLSEDRIRRLTEIGFEWRPHGMQWEKSFAALQAYQKKFGNCNVPKKWPENPYLAKWVRIQRNLKTSGKLKDDRIRQLSELGFSWSVQKKSWDEMFSELSRYFTMHGNCSVPVEWPANPVLARWVQTQRARRRARKLEDARITRLEEIGFEWDAHQADWDASYQELLGYKQQHGHANVPERWEGNPRLAAWLQVQRAQKRRGRLSKDREDLLSKLDVVWNPYEALWDEMYAALCRFHAEHGHCRVPANWSQNPKLANWVGTQRDVQADGTLSAERKTALDRIGFTWRSERRPRSRPEPWDAMFAKLEQFRVTNGHVRVPQGYAEDPRLGRWVSTQRRSRRRGTLTDALVARLDKLGFDWSLSEGKAYDEQWDSMFQELQAFQKKHGHCRVPQRYAESPRLAHWVGTQRRLRRRAALRRDREDMLEKLGFEWHVAPSRSASDEQAAWESMFAVLEQYKHAHGNCLVPQRWRENRKLAEWVSKQRIMRNKRLLNADREHRLTELGFNWDPVTGWWESMFAQLLEFQKVNGHTNVPQKVKKYEKLANWVRNQRRDYKMKRPIMKERAKRLNEIGFSWRLVEPQSWEKMFAALVEYKNAHGNCNVPQRWHEKRLAKWVNTQRTAYKRGKLRADRQSQLESVGFVWNAAAKVVSSSAGRGPQAGTIQRITPG